jgi:hypothetical protein
MGLRVHALVGCLNDVSATTESTCCVLGYRRDEDFRFESQFRMQVKRFIPEVLPLGTLLVREICSVNDFVGPYCQPCVHLFKIAFISRI